MGEGEGGVKYLNVKKGESRVYKEDSGRGRKRRGGGRVENEEWERERWRTKRQREG